MLVFDYEGEAKTLQKITPGNTPTGIGALVYEYIEKTLAYTSGGTYVMAVGDTLQGATSSAVAIIIARTITSGSDAAGTAAGVLTIKCQVGTFQSENLNVEGNSNVATIAGDSVPMRDAEQSFPRSRAKAILISVEDNAVYFTFDGSLPSQSYKAGHKISAGQSYLLKDINSIKQAKFVDAVSGSAGVVKITGLF